MKWSELYYNTVCTNYSLARLLLMVRGGLTLYNDHVINTLSCLFFLFFVATQSILKTSIFFFFFLHIYCTEIVKMVNY